MMNRIFIVEDDKLLTLVTTKMLERLGYKVVGSAASGGDALKKIESLNPDVVMLDYQLKGDLTGADILQTLRKNKNNVPVIFLSGLNIDLYKSDISDYGSIEYLVKPVNIEKLEITLKNVTSTLV